MKFLGLFHITHSSHHWANEPIVMDYLEKINFSYLEKKLKDLKLQKNAKALLIFDVFKGQTTSAVIGLLQNDIDVIHVPNNHTNLFQPLDISVNKRAKCSVSTKYHDGYAENVLEQLNRGVNAHDVKVVDFCLSTIKPHHVKWIIDM